MVIYFGYAFSVFWLEILENNNMGRLNGIGRFLIGFADALDLVLVYQPNQSESFWDSEILSTSSSYNIWTNEAKQIHLRKQHNYTIPQSLSRFGIPLDLYIFLRLRGEESGICGFLPSIRQHTSRAGESAVKHHEAGTLNSIRPQAANRFSKEMIHRRQ